jgi:hypothetical protein
MNKIRVFLTKTANSILSFWPHKLPIGFSEHEAFSTKILKNNNLPDLPSYRAAVATMIMHLGPTTDRATPRFFAKSLRASMTRQVAYEVIHRIKESEKKPDAQLVEV